MAERRLRESCGRHDRLGRGMTSRRIHLGPDLLDLAYDVVDRRILRALVGRGLDRLNGNRRRFLHVMLRLVLINRLDRRRLIYLGMVLGAGMFSSRNMEFLFTMRLAPFLGYLMLMCMVLLHIRSRLFVSGLLTDRFFVGRRGNVRFLMGMSLGRSRCRLFHIRFGMDVLSRMLLVNRLGRDILVHRRLLHLGRFRDRFLRSGKGLGMLGLDLDDCGLELVELTAQHFLGGARLHALELPLHGTASSIINLDPHFGSIFGQAVNGPSNNCYKIRHQYFLMMPGGQPGRDSS
ncbi:MULTISPECIES: hypothetical protein [unclassified Rhizobium]|uniref:hypothetical protein n=1 Tax=unclassified Rhizobium TaxID=2613769 RepID=UPI0017F1B627|nr:MULTISPECIES: hypothetical protein [unclassified Rhizobium]MBB3287939.1 hypothetical protein [Rhizobium sp. BK252]MBB3402457.1 hypothetical protein [Rhizobium sp. BK289]MBB3415033.1 hypothetical protein [Rhizobium sp. BK284]MBB3482922.1 hypothetical protein [Rhizobium sp. BK347]MDK4720547.1 hypothetical protein [Rhizobium sp. CNPSo 3968]